MTLQRTLRVLVLAGALVFPAQAFATTHIPTTRYTSNTTWTAAGSPYVLDGNVSVFPGATLTLEPGVVVKFNGQTREIFVYGGIVAEGTAAQPIVFTSLADDSVGGDTGGDGPTTGTPGQFVGIWIKNTTTVARFSYCRFTYGGWDGNVPSAFWNWGVLDLEAGTTATVGHCLFDSNQGSAIKLWSGVSPPFSSVAITDTQMTHNGGGVSVTNSTVLMTSGSHDVVTDSTMDGVYFNLTNAFSGQQSVLDDADIRNNGRYGVNLLIDPSLGAASAPVAHRDNLDGNAGAGVYSTISRPDFNWEQMYWGTVTPVPCAWAGFGWIPYHLEFGNLSAADIAASYFQHPPDGPVKVMAEWEEKVEIDDVVVTLYCGTDSVDDLSPAGSPYVH